LYHGDTEAQSGKTADVQPRISHEFGFYTKGTKFKREWTRMDAKQTGPEWRGRVVRRQAFGFQHEGKPRKRSENCLRRPLAYWGGSLPDSSSLLGSIFFQGQEYFVTNIFICVTGGVHQGIERIAASNLAQCSCRSNAHRIFLVCRKNYFFNFSGSLSTASYAGFGLPCESNRRGFCPRSQESASVTFQNVTSLMSARCLQKAVKRLTYCLVKASCTELSTAGSLSRLAFAPTSPLRTR